MNKQLKELAKLFIRYGNFVFGGGSATIAVLHREIVEKRGLLSEASFRLNYALCRLTPGTNLLAFCTGAGWTIGGLLGAVVVLLSASIPCAVIVVAVTDQLSELQYNAWVNTALTGALAAAVGITIKTSWTFTHPFVNKRSWLKVLAIVSTAFAMSYFGEISPIQILIGAGLLGALTAEKVEE